MVNDLVRNASVVLEDVEVRGAAGESDLFCDGLCEITPVSEVYRYTVDPIASSISVDS